MSVPVKWLCGLFVIAATTVVIDSAMVGFSEPDESRIGIIVWALLSSVGLHAGLLGGLLGWKFLESTVLKWVIGILMLPASLLALVVLLATVNRTNWSEAATAFLMSAIYLSVWIRLLGGCFPSARKE